MATITEKKEVVKSDVKLNEERVSNATASRIAAVTESIKVAKEERERVEKETGVVEGEGAKADREALEAKRIEQAKESRAIELVEASGGNALLQEIISKLNAVISYVNWSGDYVPADRIIEVGMKPTDSKKYNETGNI